MASEYFEEWLPSADDFHGSAQDAIAKGKTKLAAFLLHQACERLYHCVLLVCTFYTPHVHNIAVLRTQADKLDLRLVTAWLRASKADRAMLEKLKDAYVKARYSRHYRISVEELVWLSERIETLARKAADEPAG